MNKEYHILNGDALKERLSEEINGEIIVARECLVDGDVNGQTLETFYKTRAHFLSQNYADVSSENYFRDVVPEFEKMLSIPEHSKINLWFEDDLFCQVNFWFVIHLLKPGLANKKMYLVRPKINTEYGFGGINNENLLALVDDRVRLTEIDRLSLMWTHYQNHNLEELLNTALMLEKEHPYILKAVRVHIQRFPENGGLGRPEQAILKIISDLGTNEFGPVFREFCKRESIYGFGDLQFKRLFDIVTNKI